jgi:hypothetical protein
MFHHDCVIVKQARAAVSGKASRKLDTWCITQICTSRLRATLTGRPVMNQFSITHVTYAMLYW